MEGRWHGKDEEEWMQDGKGKGLERWEDEGKEKIRKNGCKIGKGRAWKGGRTKAWKR